MPSSRSKLIPIIAGLLVLLLLLGLTLGLRTVIEFDPATQQVRATRYLFLRLPVATSVQPLWSAPDTPPPVGRRDWHVMHEYRQSATGTTINHTRWGSIADTIAGWAELDLPEPASARLARRTEELITSDRPGGDLRVYILRVDAYIRYQLGATDTPPTADDIDAHFEKALTKPIDD